ncbi:hypothetical protein ACQKL5_11735 [Peribacillus sp. NPDC097675]|uniref:hypothetical protein n=1 Tax=Peribacillus sp. NPDC097675 TaxID=3390618 RepID=UPI003D03D96C
MKKLFSIMGVLVCFIFVLTPLASASELEGPESQDVSTLFIKFIDDAYKNVNLLNVEDAYGKDEKRSVC